MNETHENSNQGFNNPGSIHHLNNHNPNSNLNTLIQPTTQTGSNANLNQHNENYT
jgi:hypothetical protein